MTRSAHLRVMTAIALSCACRRDAVAVKAPAACPADSVAVLELQSSVANCAADEPRCQIDCEAGHPAACLARAYAIDRLAAHADDPKGREARALYRRACELGSANGCTNYAASLWAGRHTSEELACAVRTFEKSCAVREPFACGMAGRLLLEDTEPPRVEEGRKILQGSCDGIGGFPCRVLAKHYEEGTFGTYPTDLVPRLLDQACKGGDPDGCGKPATAAGTFH